MTNILDIHLELVDSWNRREWKATRKLLHRNYRYIGPTMDEVVGPEERVNSARLYANAFPDGKLEIRNVYIFASTTIAELRVTGTHRGNLLGIPPTGRSVDVEFCNIIEVRDDRVYRERDYMDMLDLMAQLDVLMSPIKKASAF